MNSVCFALFCYKMFLISFSEVVAYAFPGLAIIASKFSAVTLSVMGFLIGYWSSLSFKSGRSSLVNESGSLIGGSSIKTCGRK